MNLRKILLSVAAFVAMLVPAVIAVGDENNVGAIYSVGISTVAIHDAPFEEIYSNDDVTIYAANDIYRIVEKDTGNIISTLTKDYRVACACEPVCIRTIPDIDSTRYGVLKENDTLIQVARNEEWCLVKTCEQYFFLYSQHISNEWSSTSQYISNIEDRKDEEETYPLGEYIGKCRISSYCYNCNTPRHSYKSSISGVSCEEWRTCAMNGVKLGTRVYVEGFGEFKVIDRGPSAMNGARWVDLFVDTGSCDIWCKRNVWIIED